MFEILSSPDNVAAYRLIGTVTAEDFDRLVADLEARLDRNPRIGVLVDMTGCTDLTFEAAAKDLRYGFGKIFQLKRFPREALITDKQWIGAFVRAAGSLVPHVEVKTFTPAEAQAAMAWVSAFDG